MEDGQWGDSRPLACFRSEPAYVLLGDPGMGKTTALEEEAGVDGCEPVAAGDFLEDKQLERISGLLFIDGMDEVRAGEFDRRSPMGAIRSRLQDMGKPRFRLSCRAADWLGAVDANRLEQVVPEGALKVLQLDPLDDAGIRAILANHDVVADDFIGQARGRGVAELLGNPQTLEMLVRVVEIGGDWPQGLLETFEKACALMSCEHNREHRAARRRSLPVPSLLDAAGRLCALQLICGLRGVALDSDDAGSGFPFVDDFGDDLSADDHEALRLSLSRRLFASAGTGRFVPVHRRVAEFLGARHLAQRIGQGLSARRVLALITGEDGRVVTPLRGLSAWLAAHCRAARRTAIRSDPVGVGLYGDIRAFAREDKALTIDCLSREPPAALPYGLANTVPFALLAMPDMAPVLRDWLLSSERSHRTENFVSFLLDVVTSAGCTADVVDLLPGLVRDSSRWMIVRRSAARCLAEVALKDPDRLGARRIWRVSGNSDGIPGRLGLGRNVPPAREAGFVALGPVARGLMNDLRGGRLEDPEHEVLGTFLHVLYPGLIPPDQVCKYWLADLRGNFLGHYRYFWLEVLAEKTPHGEVPNLLDSLVDGDGELGTEVETAFSDILSRLIAKALEAHQACPDVRRLYRWLNLGATWQQPRTKELERIAHWIGQRPAVVKELTTMELTDIIEGVWTSVDLWQLGVSFPADFGRWCLDQAANAAEPKHASAWLIKAWRALESHQLDKALSLEDFEEACSRDGYLQSVFDRLRETRLDDRSAVYQRKMRRRARRLSDKRREEQRQRRGYFGRFAVDLGENRCPADVMQLLADAYWGHYADIGGDSPDERLDNLVGNDPALGAVAIEGLRDSICRDDLPTPDEIFELFDRGQQHPLALPVLAGLNLAEGKLVRSLARGQARSIIAFGLSIHPLCEPQNFGALLLANMDLAGSEILRFARAALRRGDDHLPMVYEVAREPELAELARSVVPALLKGFPVRASRNLGATLTRLLCWGVQNLDAQTMAGVADRKLQAKSMTLAQRSRWLAAALVVEPGESNLAHVGGFAKAHRDAMSGFFAVLENSPVLERLLQRMPSDLLGCLVRLLAADRRPVRASESDYAAFEEATLIRSLIEDLGTRTHDGARTTLAALRDDPVLTPWRTMLSHVQAKQSVRRRDACYEHPTIEAAGEALQGGQPASPADLHAVSIEAIEEVADRICNGFEDGWKQYWNVDSRERPTDPRPENTCRDSLAFALEGCLPRGLEIQIERRYRGRMRSDIALATGGFNVPVEIKVEGSRELWTGLRAQLITKYVRDPGANGHGIYVVMWFGKQPIRHPETRTPIDNPSVLRVALEAMLSTDEQRAIAVRVIDLSR